MSGSLKLGKMHIKLVTKAYVVCLQLRKKHMELVGSS